MRERFGQGLYPDKVVRNYMYSRRCLSPDEKQVLALGLNFAVTPRTIPTETIIASTEATEAESLCQYCPAEGQTPEEQSTWTPTQSSQSP